ncbi:hypothetical protein [Acinetobacter junii]|uniref:hypothetical protein n=1 Tax=Acinetobacter junii TaxID=40215 RepID=UPI00124C15E6|nr:hypothetical protein [Acinetobacter junii]
MATDVDVQYFSHLNGLTLGNNWGDMIRLLDTCLVNGLPFTSVTSASIDAQGDITLNLYAAHNAMLFQVVELTGFSPSEINGKYRIKGTPTTAQLILKAAHTGKTIATVGTAKLASLGYEIIFRDTNDVKRVYRAKNPTSQHPFIRVDESLTSPDGTTGVYTSSYAKYAMVGLLEHMEHIDDFENPNVLQLPFNPADPAKNWKIAGTGGSVVRGWSKWHYAAGTSESTSAANGNRDFLIIGDRDAFYNLISYNPSNPSYQALNGVGLFNSVMSEGGMIPDWFLMTFLSDKAASANSLTFMRRDQLGGVPLTYNGNGASFFIPSYSPAQRIKAHAVANPMLSSFSTGANAVASASLFPALEIPINSNESILRGSLKHVLQILKTEPVTVATPYLLDKYAYIVSPIGQGLSFGSIAFYLGKIA